MPKQTDPIIRFSMQPKDKADYAQIFEEDVASFFPELDMTWDPTQGCYRNQTMRNCELAWLAARKRFHRLTLRGFGPMSHGMADNTPHAPYVGSESAILFARGHVVPPKMTGNAESLDGYLAEKKAVLEEIEKFNRGGIFEGDIWEIKSFSSQRQAPKPTWWQRVKVWFPWN